MGQKETIIDLLKSNIVMTQAELADTMYGEKGHGPNIYAALSELLTAGVVVRIGSNLSYYYLSGVEFILPTKKVEAKKGTMDVPDDVVEAMVEVTDNYDPENEMISRCLKKYPANMDPDLVAMEIGLIDITNSTHLSQNKSKISMVELANIIASIPNIDERIAVGDPEVVNEIARSNGKINLFSFPQNIAVTITEIFMERMTIQY